MRRRDELTDKLMTKSVLTIGVGLVFGISAAAFYPVIEVSAGGQNQPPVGESKPATLR